MNNKFLGLILVIMLIPVFVALISTSANNAYAAVSTISVTQNPKWNITTVQASGALSSLALLGQTVTVTWNATSGCAAEVISLSAGQTTWATTTGCIYPKADSNVQKTISAQQKQGSLPIGTAKTATTTVQKHTTALSAPSLTAPMVSDLDFGPAVPWGHTFNALSTLTDSDNGGSTISNPSLTYSGTGVSGSPSGTSSVTITAPGDGTGVVSTAGTGHTVAASFAGSSQYEAATSSDSTIDIKRHATSISLDLGGLTEIKWGKTISASAILTDEDDGIPIEGKIISFFGSAINSSTNSSATDSSGDTGITTLTTKSVVGTGKTVSAWFDSTNDPWYRTSRSSTATIELTKHTTSLSTPDLSVADVKWGKTFTASVILTDSDNGDAAISGKTIKFTGTAITPGSTGTTDGNGDTGNVTLEARKAVGTGKTVIAHFAGNALYEAATSDDVTIELTKHATMFTGTPTPSAGPYTLPGTLEATVTLVDTDAGDAGVNNAKVVFKGTAVTSGFDTTDIDGNATANLTIKATGNNRTIFATFAGNAFYEAAANSAPATISIT